MKLKYTILLLLKITYIFGVDNTKADHYVEEVELNDKDEPVKLNVVNIDSNKKPQEKPSQLVEIVTTTTLIASDSNKIQNVSSPSLLAPSVQALMQPTSSLTPVPTPAPAPAPSNSNSNPSEASSATLNLINMISKPNNRMKPNPSSLNLFVTEKNQSTPSPIPTKADSSISTSCTTTSSAILVPPNQGNAVHNNNLIGYQPNSQPLPSPMSKSTLTVTATATPISMSNSTNIKGLRSIPYVIYDTSNSKLEFKFNFKSFIVTLVISLGFF